MDKDPTEEGQFVFYAKLAEQAERYDDMVAYMQRFVLSTQREMTIEERNLFSVAFKNQISNRRAAWRIVHSIRDRNEYHQNGYSSENQKQMLHDYLEELAQRIVNVANHVMALLDNEIAKPAQSGEAKTFYYKMKGDYYRYIAEVQTSPDERRRYLNAGKTCFDQSLETANQTLAPTHPIRLGLCLSWSVWYYEMLNEPEKAIALAQATFDEAIAHLDELTEDSYKDSTLIMQLLRDNLTLWRSANEEEEEDNRPSTVLSPM